MSILKGEPHEDEMERIESLLHILGNIFHFLKREPKKSTSVSIAHDDCSTVHEDHACQIRIIFQ
jgi:hypothetical protein